MLRVKRNWRERKRRCLWRVGMLEECMGGFDTGSMYGYRNYIYYIRERRTEMERG